MGAMTRKTNPCPFPGDDDTRPPAPTTPLWWPETQCHPESVSNQISIVQMQVANFVCNQLDPLSPGDSLKTRRYIFLRSPATVNRMANRDLNPLVSNQTPAQHRNSANGRAGLPPNHIDATDWRTVWVNLRAQQPSGVAGRLDSTTTLHRESRPILLRSTLATRHNLAEIFSPVLPTLA